VGVFFCYHSFMKVTYKYDKKEDIWCITNKGKISHNSPHPTKVYELMVNKIGENPEEKEVSKFIDEYLEENNYNVELLAKTFEKEFVEIADKYHKIAEQVFGVTLKNDVVGYLTVNNRCPYSIQENLFFVSVSVDSANRIAMHELWHFYTWYRFPNDVLKIDPVVYNDIKESLSVLLNIECKELYGEGVEDKGYPRHEELRKRIVTVWNKTKDIQKVWDDALNFIDKL